MSISLPSRAGRELPAIEEGKPQQAPGAIVRCRTCDNVLMAFVTTHDRMCVDLQGLAVLS
jgi:hypothetical protein